MQFYFLTIILNPLERELSHLQGFSALPRRDHKMQSFSLTTSRRYFYSLNSINSLMHEHHPHMPAHTSTYFMGAVSASSHHDKPGPPHTRTAPADAFFSRKPQPSNNQCKGFLKGTCTAILRAINFCT